MLIEKALSVLNEIVAKGRVVFAGNNSFQFLCLHQDTITATDGIHVVTVHVNRALVEKKLVISASIFLAFASAYLTEETLEKLAITTGDACHLKCGRAKVFCPSTDVTLPELVAPDDGVWRKVTDEFKDACKRVAFAVPALNSGNQASLCQVYVLGEFVVGADRNHMALCKCESAPKFKAEKKGYGISLKGMEMLSFATEIMVRDRFVYLRGEDFLYMEPRVQGEYMDVLGFMEKRQPKRDVLTFPDSVSAMVNNLSTIGDKLVQFAVPNVRLRVVEKKDKRYLQVIAGNIATEEQVQDAVLLDASAKDMDIVIPVDDAKAGFSHGQAIKMDKDGSVVLFCSTDGVFNLFSVLLPLPVEK